MPSLFISECVTHSEREMRARAPAPLSDYCAFDVAMFMKLSTSSCIFFSIGAFK